MVTSANCLTVVSATDCACMVAADSVHDSRIPAKVNVDVCIDRVDEEIIILLDFTMLLWGRNGGVV